MRRTKVVADSPRLATPKYFLFCDSRYFQRNFCNPASQVLRCSYAEFIAADIVVAAVDERSPEVACGPAVADNNHLLAKQRSLNGLDGQFLTAVSRAANRNDTRDLSGQSKIPLAEKHTMVEKGFA